MRRLLLVLPVLVLLTACSVGPNRLGVSAQQWQAMDDAQRAQMITGYQKIKWSSWKQRQTVFCGPDILVSLGKGTALMPPFTQSYAFQRVSFQMNPGRCRTVELNSVDTSNEVDLKACYNGLTLLLDPSRYDALKSTGSLRLDYNPLWKRGFTYAGVSSSGYVQLNKVNVTIKAIADLAPVEDVDNSRP